MAKIIKNGTVQDNVWQVVRLTEGETAQTAALPASPALVPLTVWQERRAELLARQQQYGWPLGVWLAPDEDPKTIADDVDFPKFVDGRGYSTARLLRSRYFYQGELRSIGDVQRDQLFYQRRAGFDAFAVRADHDIEAAVNSLNVFNAAYQFSTDSNIDLQRRSATDTNAKSPT